MITMYGIKNCDTIKKARNWLDNERVPYSFHDYKVSGVDKDKLEEWVCLLYTSPSPRDKRQSRMPSSA